MSQKKVKLFQNVVSIQPGGGAGQIFTIEQEINEFLSGNPNINLIDIQLSSNAAPVGERVTNYGLCALLVYEEA